MLYRRLITAVVFAAVVSAAAATAAQSLPDSTAARGMADKLRAKADSLNSRADSLGRTSGALKASSDSILLEAGLKIPAQPDHWNGSFGLGYTLNRGNSEQQPGRTPAF